MYSSRGRSYLDPLVIPMPSLRMRVVSSGDCARAALKAKVKHKLPRVTRGQRSAGLLGGDARAHEAVAMRIRR